MTDWITDRLPTEADADLSGDVIVCTSPTLHKQFKEYENWRDVTPGWPWRHTEYWTTPTPTPEPTPAAPEFRVGQVWRTRKGKVCEIIDITHDRNFPIHTNLYMGHWHRPNGGSCLASDDQDHEDDLVELISENPPQPEPVVTTLTPAAPKPEPEKATRGFAWFNRVDVNPGHEVEEYAVATDGTAWWRIIGKDDRLEDKKWIQVRPLPQPGEE